MAQQVAALEGRLPLSPEPQDGKVEAGGMEMAPAA
jgi:hypothetical protein